MLAFDQAHILHPYAPSNPKSQMQMVESASGVYLHLQSGEKIIDGMSSWWSVIHGYNVPELNEAAKQQLEKMSHVMFGGLTHESAIKLAQILLSITDDSLEKIFFSDSGSVSVEVALKMAFQYQEGRGKKSKNKILAFERGYHGDTFGAMSVCDPVTGMHAIFGDILHKNIFAPKPEKSTEFLKKLLQENENEIAAVIIEPIVQGAGGMRFYEASFLNELRLLCNEFDVLLIFDEIATGFGRTGKMFAYEHTEIVPDILCVGKALTGGYLSLAATIASKKVFDGIEAQGNILMHGPTFMANPLACAVASASLELLLASNWKNNIAKIEKQLLAELSVCENLEIVKEVRVLGAIGVVELHQEIDLAFMTPLFISKGVWLRPFLNLVYIMPPYIISPEQLSCLSKAIFEVISVYENHLQKEKHVKL